MLTGSNGHGSDSLMMTASQCENSEVTLRLRDENGNFLVDLNDRQLNEQIVSQDMESSETDIQFRDVITAI